MNAKRLYELHLYEWDKMPKEIDEENETLDHICVAKTYLLLALHLQRIGDIDGARSAFREGAERFEADAEQRGCEHCRSEAAQLYLSWGLLESKQDKFEFAWLLVTKAVQLDQDKIGVSSVAYLGSQTEPTHFEISRCQEGAGGTRRSSELLREVAKSEKHSTVREGDTIPHR